MKLPEIPGRIIAQMATAPHRNTNHSPSGVSVGVSVQITAPRPTPKTVRTTSLNFHPEIPRRMKTDDATMSPKKNAHV